MNKLYRSLLAAGVLAFGLSACGDDVTVVDPADPPPPALSAEFAPQEVNVAVDQTVSLGLNISGGAEGSDATWTCSVDDSDIATVAESASGCAVTGVADGSTSVTADVSKGNQSASASAAVNVAQLERAEVSIASMPSPTPLSGDAEFVINMTPNDEDPTRLELVFIDDEGNEVVVDAQNFSSSEMAEMAEARSEGPAEQTQQITFDVNTAATDTDDETGLMSARVINGEYTVQARLFTVQSGEAAPSATNERTTEVENEDYVEVTHVPDAGETPAMTALRVDAGEGTRYWGGGDLVFQAHPILFSGGEPETVTVSTDGDAEIDETEIGHPFTFDVLYEDNFNAVEDTPGETNGHNFTATEVLDPDGVDVTPGTFVDLEDFHIDMTPPSIEGSIVIDNDPPTTVPAGEYFSAGDLALSTPPTDAGVGIGSNPMTFAALFDGDEVADDVEAIDDEVFTEAGDDQWQVSLLSVMDRVGNSWDDADDIEDFLDDEGTSEEFNVDKTGPETTVSAPDSDDTYVFSGTGGVSFRAIDPELDNGDDPSGVDETGATVEVENLTEESDAEFAVADGTEDDDVDDRFNFNFDVGANMVAGDGVYELTVNVPDQAIVPNTEPVTHSFILDTTAPELDLTNTPSNISTSASSAQFTIAGEITDENGINTGESLIEIMTPASGTTCAPYGDGDLYEEDDEIDRNEVEFGESAEFSETFTAENPDPNGANVTRTYCVWVTGADEALDADGDEDPNISREQAVFSIEWNPDGEPVGAENISIAAGNNQSIATDGTSDDLVVSITDQLGDPVDAQDVDWTSTGVSVTLSDATTATDGDGLASITVDADGVAGSVEITATHAEAGSVTFDLTIVGAEFATAEIVEGETQTAPAGEESGAMVLQALDQFGEPINGVDVAWAIDTDNGSTFNVEEVLTSGDGEAQATVDINAAEEDDATITVTATVDVGGVEQDLTFTITVGAREAEELVIDGDAEFAIEPGESTTLAVDALDQFDDPVDGIEVTFTASGASATIDPGSDETDAGGPAETLFTAGGSTGTTTVTASADGLDPVTWTISIEEAEATTIEANSAEEVGVAAGASTTLDVLVEDQFEAAFEGATVTFTVVSGDATIDGGATFDDDSDGAGIASAEVDVDAGATDGDEIIVEAETAGVDGTVTFTITVTP